MNALHPASPPVRERWRTAGRFADVLVAEIKTPRNSFVARAVSWLNLCRLCQDLEEQMQHHVVAPDKDPEDDQWKSTDLFGRDDLVVVFGWVVLEPLGRGGGKRVCPTPEQVGLGHPHSASADARLVGGGGTDTQFTGGVRPVTLSSP
jgi:hypothetical protein